MTPKARSLFITIAVAFIAGLGGVWLGKTVLGPAPHQASLHDAIHREFNLNQQQRQRIEGLERDFAARRQALELEMRAANADLATAIRTEHGNGPAVTAAIARCHQVMGELQNETMRHVFAMREVLTPAQRERFDTIVAAALTAEPQ